MLRHNQNADGIQKHFKEEVEQHNTGQNDKDRSAGPLNPIQQVGRDPGE